MNEELNQAPIQPDMVTIESMDDLARAFAHWHHNVVARIKNLLEIPEGTEMTLEIDGRETAVKLAGEILTAYQGAILTVLSEFQDLPFSADMEKPETSDAAPQGH